MICMTCATQKRPGTHGNTYLRVSSIVRNRRCLLHYDMAKVSWGSICGMVASMYASVERIVNVARTTYLSCQLNSLPVDISCPKNSLQNWDAENIVDSKFRVDGI